MREFTYPVLIAKQLKEDGEEVVVLECGEGAQNDELLLGPREGHIHPPPVAQELAHLCHGVAVLAPPRRQSQEKETLESTFFSALERTKDTMMQSLSRPWYLSTVWISVASPVTSLICVPRASAR